MEKGLDKIILLLKKGEILCRNEILSKSKVFLVSAVQISYFSCHGRNSFKSSEKVQIGPHLLNIDIRVIGFYFEKLTYVARCWGREFISRLVDTHFICVGYILFVF